MCGRKRRIVLAGLGPHARRMYYPMLERAARQYDIEIPLILELEDQRTAVDSFLGDRKLRAGHVLYLPVKSRGGGLHPDAASHLENCVADGGIDGMIIATEPQAHYAYALWALDHSVPVLLDKPITAFPMNGVVPDQPLRLYDDFTALRRAALATDTACLIQTQRRAHVGYNAVRDYVHDVILQVGVPITSIDVYHGDGMWNMPTEYKTRENHPYKYGYGKLMHSGYHFIDLAAWFLQLNASSDLGEADRIELLARGRTPFDVLHQVSPQRHALLLDDVQLLGAVPDEYRDYGETDVFLYADFFSGDAVAATATANLLQTSFSRRAWSRLPVDTYKGNGRVRHERLSLQVGHLLAVHVESYQTTEISEGSHDTTPGGSDHFEVLVFRNAQLLGQPAFERLDFGRSQLQFNDGDGGTGGPFESARYRILLAFLGGHPSDTDIRHHELGVKLLAAAYSLLARRRRGIHSLGEIDLKRSRDWLRFADST